LLGSFCLSSRLPNGREHMTTEHTGGSFRQIKKKTIQLKCGRLPVNYRDLPSVTPSC
jgi:hypothetical protein